MNPAQRNPVFWLMWMIPGAAVLAGLSMVAVAMQDADRALPEAYHWEGERLDADFERVRNAARLGVSATLTLREGTCVVDVVNAPDTASLRLLLTNGNDSKLDRAVELVRGDANYRADCAPLPRGRWRVALQDAGNSWLLRGNAGEAFARFELRARDPAGAQP
jgi:uncharacterized protein